MDQRQLRITRLDEITEEMFTEYEDEKRADKVEEEVQDRISRTVDHEDRFDSETVSYRVNYVLDQLPEQSADDDGSEDPGPRIVPAAFGHSEGESTENARRESVREVIPPADGLVRAQHPHRVCDHGDADICTLPRPEFDGKPSLGGIGKVRPQ